MSRNSFLDKDNIDLLWDVITDEDFLTGRSSDIMKQVADVFNNNIRGFFESADNKSNTLIELNKKYILLVISYVKKHMPVTDDAEVKKKIKIHDIQTNINHTVSTTDHGELVTRRDIQDDKLSSFDKKYTQMQQDFTDSMTLKVPPVPIFSDTKDEPLGEMELAIKKITEQRKYDIEQINKNHSPDASAWLNSKDTSIKNPQPVKNDAPTSSSAPKYIKIHDGFIDDEHAVVDLDKRRNLKHISWSDDNPDKGVHNTKHGDIITQARISDNLFSKFKKVEPIQSNDIQGLYDGIKTLDNKVNTLTDIVMKLLEERNTTKNHPEF